MIIPIDDKHRIASDAHQWLIQKQRLYLDKKTGKETSTWENIAYFSSLKCTLERLIDLKLRLYDGNTLEDALNYLEILCKQLEDSLKPIITIDIKSLNGGKKRQAA